MFNRQAIRRFFVAGAPTLGLSVFCQRFLVWEVASEQSNLSFYDLLALAERQRVTTNIALRIID